MSHFVTPSMVGWLAWGMRFVDTSWCSQSLTFAISGFTTWRLAVSCRSPWLLPKKCRRIWRVRVQWASEHDLASIAQTVPKSIWPFELHQRIHMHKMKENRIRAMRIIGLLHTEVVWHTHQSPHTIWCSPMRPHMDWLCDGIWTLSMGQCTIQTFLHSDQCLTHVRKMEESHTHTQISPWNYSGAAFACQHVRLKQVYKMSRAWGFEKGVHSPLLWVVCFVQPYIWNSGSISLWEINEAKYRIKNFTWYKSYTK